LRFRKNGYIRRTDASTARSESVEHGFNLTDELLQLMKEKGTYLVGTDFPEEHLRAMYPNSSRDQKGQAERIIDRLRRAYKIGVKMAFGSDIVIDLPGKIDRLSGHKSKRRRSPNRRRHTVTL